MTEQEQLFCTLVVLLKGNSLMGLFTARFYAIMSLVIMIVSLAITVSVANAQKTGLPVPTPLTSPPASLSLQADMPATAKSKADPKSKTNKQPRCLGLVSAEFISRGRTANKLNAIRAWRKKVVADYGEKYKHWSVSQGHKVKCGAGGAKNRCVASARPCRIIKWKMPKRTQDFQG